VAFLLVLMVDLNENISRQAAKAQRRKEKQ
jgi:hypothetical protein